MKFPGWAERSSPHPWNTFASKVSQAIVSAHALTDIVMNIILLNYMNTVIAYLAQGDL